jgi:hypothetical protein
VSQVALQRRLAGGGVRAHVSTDVNPSGIFFFAMGHLLPDDRRMSPKGPGLCENTLLIIAHGKKSRKYFIKR